MSDANPPPSFSPAVCAEIRDLLAESSEGALAPAELARVQAHLQLCPQCRAVASWMPALDEAARRESPVPPTAEWVAHLHQRVMEEVRAEASQRHGVDPSLARVERTRGLRSLWPRWPEFFHSPRVLAGISIAALVGIFTYAQLRDHGVLGEPAKPTSIASGGAERPAPPARETSTEFRKSENELADERSEEQSLREPAMAKNTQHAEKDGAAAPATEGKIARLELDARPQVAPAENEPARVVAEDQAKTEAVPSDRLLTGVASPTTLAAAEKPAAVGVDSTGWDPRRARAALAQLGEAQSYEQLEDAAAAVLAALEDAPEVARARQEAAARSDAEPTTLVAPLLKAQPSPQGGATALQAQEARQAASAGTQSTARAAQSRRAEPASPAVPPGTRAVGELQAEAAPTPPSATLVDSAAVALERSLARLPEGPLRERVAGWLRAHGHR